MTDAALQSTTRQIVVDDVFPHAPEVVWKALTTRELMARWLKMPMAGFAPVKGTRFTYTTTPAGQWDGTIHCEVLEAIPCERLVYSWRSGHSSNTAYGAELDTVVTFTLSRVGNGTRLRLVHAGFVFPRNEIAHKNMSGGWKHVVTTIGVIAGEQAS